MTQRVRTIPGARFATLAACLMVAVVACGPDETTSVIPQLVPPPEVTDFGAVPVLNEKLAEIPVLNVGRGALQVKNVSITEANVPFRVVSFPDSLGPSEEKPIEVVFLPPLEQAYEATLVLETDDRTHPIVEVRLEGEGSTRAVMEIEPDAIDFGRVAEGSAAVKTFTLRSTGTADLIVEEIAFAEGSAPVFEFLGSVATPAVVKAVEENGLPGEIQVAVRYTVTEGAPDLSTATIRVRGTDPDNREVLIPVTGAVNRAPIAVIEDLGVGAPGMEVTLDGSMSSDPDGDVPLGYKWVLRSKPLGATTTIAEPEQPVTRMTLDAKLPGEYVVELTVTDQLGAKNLAVARASIVAAPAQKLMVEMFWNNTRTDIDLHFLQSPQTEVGTIPGDCFYQNKTPDWGSPGIPTDDPEFIRDALTGYGPEVVGYVNPVDGSKYRVVAEFKRDNGAVDRVSEVTVRIYLYGKVEFEQKKVLSHVGEAWGVADIEWPSGTITPLQP